MEVFNQVLVQLSEADRFASAANPHHRRLAVVLLDNIVELQLRRKVNLQFLCDQTTWFDGPRKYNKKTRRAVCRHHPELVAFAEQHGWLEQSEGRLLSFAHRIRNESYHEGGFDALDGELAVRLLYSLIKKRFPEWRCARGLVFISPHSPLPIGEAATDASGTAPLLTRPTSVGDEWVDYSANVESAEFWRQALSDVLRYSGVGDISQLVHDRVTSYLDELECSMDFIQSASDRVNFLDVISWRMSILTPAFSTALIDGKSQGFNGALNVYAAVLPEEERLLDIVDPQERATACHALLQQHKFQRKFMPKERVRKYRRQATRLLEMDAKEGVELFLEIEADLSAKREAVRELTFDLDRHFSHIADLARGK